MVSAFEWFKNFLGIDLFEAVGVASGYSFFYFCAIFLAIGLGMFMGFRMDGKRLVAYRMCAAIGIFILSFVFSAFREGNFVEYAPLSNGVGPQAQVTQSLTIVPIPWQIFSNPEYQVYFPGGARYASTTAEQMREIVFNRDNRFGSWVIIIMQTVIFCSCLGLLSFLMAAPLKMIYDKISKHVCASIRR